MTHVTDRRYPKCSEAKLLRATNGANIVISTTALRAHLGESLYDRCRKVFSYDNNSGPRPNEIEQFLKSTK